MQQYSKNIQTEVVVIGAGLTGLSLAYTLKRKGVATHVVERNDRIGGQIQTHRVGDYLMESGPNTGVVSYPEVAELMAELAETSGGSCVPEYAPKSSKRRLIWKGNRFHDLPSGPVGGLTTPLFTFADKLRILGEPWRSKGTDPNESVGSLARRRLGKSFVDYAVDPFLAGVYAGDADRLITRFALPKLYDLEQQYGSFIRGAIAKAKEPKTERDRLASKEVFSAVGGLSRITQAEAAYIGSENISLNAAHVQTAPTDNGWQVTFDTSEGSTCCQCSKVVTTCGAYALRQLLPFVADSDLRAIESLRYAPMVEVGVGVRDAMGGDFTAFGGLVPSCEQKNVLGILFPSACFTGRAPEGGALFTYFMGGLKHAELPDKTDAELEAIVEEHFHTMLKFPPGVKPDVIRIFRHRKAIPQYELSTSARLEAVARIRHRYPGLIVAGNLRDGIGMAHRIKQARDIAADIHKP